MTDDVDWVQNARASGWGILRDGRAQERIALGDGRAQERIALGDGRAQERIALVELPVEERPPILRRFPRAVPAGVQFFRRLYDLPRNPDDLPEAFAALAPRCPVFRGDPATKSCIFRSGAARAAG